MSFAAELISRVSARASARRRRPREDVELAGLARPATVTWDSSGVPHLEAENLRDLLMLQGYVTARERAFQMDFSRRAIAGRLAEILGDREMDWKDLTIHLKGRTISQGDLLLRTLGMRRAAEASVDQHSDETRELLFAYAHGATEAFTNMKRPVEMRLLRYNPEPWTPADSISIIKGMAFELSFAWRTVLLLDAISHQLRDREDAVRRLFPTWPDHAKPPSAWNGLREHSADGLDVEESYRAFTALGGAHVGSNAWVVSGEHTETGHPMLCGDPHLMMTAPSTHFMVHLRCPELHSAGSSIPGVPGVVMGHNERIAWSMTASCGHDADVFVERLDVDNGRYAIEDGWADLETHEEEIHIKGQPGPTRHSIHSTRHGPLIHEVTYPLSGRNETYAHALRWTGQDASRDVDAILGMNRASNWTEFRDALRLLTSPSLNFVYADVDGHIGWQLAGAFPVRKDGSDGLLPTDGASDEAGWSRYLDLDELPHLYDPPQGVIVSANTKPVDDSYPWPLGHTWEPWFRYRRISELLGETVAGRKLGVHDMVRIQRDQFSTWAEGITQDLLRPALEHCTFEDEDVEEARRRLLAWDYESHPDSTGASVFYFTYETLVRDLLETELGPDIAHAYLEMLNLAVMPFESLIQDKRAPLLAGHEREHRVEHALRSAAVELGRRLGEPDEWRWGRLHRLWHRHRLHQIPGLRNVFSVGPFEVGGDGMCVNNGHYSHANPFEMLVGPGLRHIHVVGRWESSRFMTGSGNGGDPLSASYREYAAQWAAGEFRVLHFDPASYADGRAQRFRP